MSEYKCADCEEYDKQCGTCSLGYITKKNDDTCMDFYIDKKRKVVVCDACLRASCWQGFFYCEKYLTAGTKELTIKKLEKLSREHPSYWNIRCVRKYIV